MGATGGHVCPPRLPEYIFLKLKLYEYASFCPGNIVLHCDWQGQVWICPQVSTGHTHYNNNIKWKSFHQFIFVNFVLK